jgi:hypothetical protein
MGHLHRILLGPCPCCCFLLFLRVFISPSSIEVAYRIRLECSLPCLVVLPATARPTFVLLSHGRIRAALLAVVSVRAVQTAQSSAASKYFLYQQGYLATIMSAGENSAIALMHCASH